MEKALERKITMLRERIRKLDSALVAFSGGVDSTFLMRICREELGEKAVAVTTLSKGYPRGDLTMARRVAKILGVKHLVIKHKKKMDTGVDDSSEGAHARAIRSGSVYSQLKSVAMRMKLGNVMDGSHRDDRTEKGKKFMAAKHAGIHSPLLESNLSKAEIRLLARELGLPNWDAPSSSEKKKKAPKAAAKAKAKEYLCKAAPGAGITFHGTRAIIAVDKRTGLQLLSKLGRMQGKLRKLGFTEVIIKVKSEIKKSVTKKRPKKKAARKPAKRKRR